MIAGKLRCAIRLLAAMFASGTLLAGADRVSTAGPAPGLRAAISDGGVSAPQVDSLSSILNSYPHLGELTPETYTPVDEALSESGISVELRAEVELFLASKVGDVCLQQALQRVEGEDAASTSHRVADGYASKAQASRGSYGSSPSGSLWPVLDRYGRIWQYAAETCVKRAGSRSTQFKAALLPLLTAYYRERGNSSSARTCPSVPAPKCQRCLPYRTADGTCNSLARPRSGAAGASLRRLAKSAYEDGVGRPRQTSVLGGALPSARKVSTTVISRESNLSGKHTHMLMQWAQFLDHDLTSSPMIAGADGIGLACCADEIQRAMNLTDAQAAALQLQLNDRYGCFNIPVPADDPAFKGRKCLGFSRSSTAPEQDCRLGQRSPVNKLTSFIDGSMVYGSTQDEQNALRSFGAGRLRTLELRGRRSLPPQKNDQVCNKDSDANECFTAGDDRINEQPGLLSMHTLLVREHNRVATGLQQLNPSWNDEKLFQEARKIVAAEIQHITYEDFLPIILGPGVYATFGLQPRPDAGYFAGYNAEAEATIRTEFSSVAYRFGHTLIRNTFSLDDVGYRSIGSFKLQDQYFAPGLIYNSSVTEGAVLRGLLRDPAENFDFRITTQVTDHLFETGAMPNTPLDLVALNIQRARDHGIPSYVRLRQVLGMRVPTSFDDLASTHDASVIALFKRAYADVRDIDAFPGGVTERSLPGAVLGPLFAKIVAIQFALAKTGDRFYYENDCRSAFGSCGLCNFTPAQLKQIKMASLSRLLCDNIDISVIQKNAFLIGQQYLSCKNVPSVNLKPWKNA